MVNEVEEKLLKYLEVETELLRVQRLLEFEKNEIECLSDSISDLKESTTEKLSDRINKKEQSKISLMKSNQQYDFEKLSLQNQIEILNHFDSKYIHDY